ncbi:hypothetical protein [Lujinxingia vulgaris]|uniref:hypothetical protein n=1 Tax=Lujinxingia vulgaris TaxID=2600176 RepID=UPI001E412CA0|nr:hypothetical protein [Lujinxingia vulgaris]
MAIAGLCAFRGDGTGCGGRLSTARTTRERSQEWVYVDLLFASSGIEVEIVEQAQAIAVIPEVVIPVARPGHLFALKLLSESADERPQDAMDLRSLREIIVGEERKAAEEATRLIMDRGYGRGRDLSSRLKHTLREGDLG